MIHSYHIYHRITDEGGHSLVTMIKRTVPSEEAEQIYIGDGTETQSFRRWLNYKPLVLDNVYRVDRGLHITTPLTREQRAIMAEEYTPETRCGAETTIEQL